jgi:class 3 adenylate cyclase/tetratricopeptide (TPR) repeat protein/ribosomal protein L40E
MECPKCGSENRNEAKFCGKCRSKLSRICPQCKAENPPDNTFCDQCGADFIVPKKPTPIDYTQPQSYTPKHLADKILTTRRALEGERKLVTVLFADVANFTSLSEKLEPEEVHQIMEGCLRILMDEIHKYEGTINQFTGDGVMALFGAPLAHEDHAQRACYAALAIQKDLAEYSEKIMKDYGREFQMRIGLNSGPVVVGSIGDDLHMDYTAIGDTINLASRMEGLAQPGTVLLSRDTQRLVKDYFDLKPIGPLEVKGKEEPQEAYELVKAGGAATRLEASMARGLTRFVGRKNSMAALMEAFDKVSNGTGQIVGMVGEAGVGKSRLLFEFRHQLPQGEFGYLEGHCIHYGGAMPYLPILDLLRSYFEIREGEREMVIRKRVKERILGLDEKLQGIISPIQDILSLKVEDEAYLKLEPKQRREKVFEALRDLFIRESQERPLVLVIEDLHWIDKTSEEFLDYLIGWLANVKIMLILLHRPEYAPRWGTKSYFNRIGLDQLTLKSSAELVRAILEGGETAPELSSLILNRAAGNPLFMEELTHSLLENGSIQKTGDQYVLSPKPSALQVPDTIQGIIAARIDRLEENLKRIMQVASVIGREFAFRILQTIMEMKEELKSHLLNLQGLEFIYEKRLFPELEYIFKHALTQEVAYNSLLLKRRKEIHEKTGQAMEELYPERLEEFYEMLAYHYFRSDNLDKAFQYLKLSGKKSTQNYSQWEAYRFYQEALSLLKQLPKTDENKREQVEVITLMAMPIFFLGFPEDSLNFLHEGERLAKELEDGKSRAYLINVISTYYYFRGDTLLALKYYEDGFAEAEKIQDIELMIQSGTGLSNMGDHKKIREIAPKVIALLEKTHRESDFFGIPANPYSFLQAIYGYGLAQIGEFRAGEELFEKALHYAQKINHIYTLGVVEFLFGMLFVFKGDGKNVLKHTPSAIEYMEKSQATIYLTRAWVTQGFGYYLLGEIKSALECTEKGLKMVQDIGLTFGLASIYNNLSRIHGDSGNWEEAKVQAELALKFGQTNQEKATEGISWLHLGRAVGKLDHAQLDMAEENIRKGMEILEELENKPSFSQGRYFLGELYADAGLKEKALENLKKAEAMFQEMGMDYWLDRTRTLLAKV